MKSRERVLLSLDHREPDRVPLFSPNVMRTREPYPEEVHQFLDQFAFDGLAHVGNVVSAPSERREV